MFLISINLEHIFLLQTESFDLLCPFVGELAGGSLRAATREQLERQCPDGKLPEALKWYGSFIDFSFILWLYFFCNTTCSLLVVAKYFLTTIVIETGKHHCLKS